MDDVDFYRYVEVEQLSSYCDKNESDNDIMIRNKQTLNLQVRNDVNYKGVTEVSIKLLEEAERNDRRNEKDLIDTSIGNSIKPNKRKTQTDVDREIVSLFYKNPTAENFGMIWKRFYYGVLSFAHKMISDMDNCNDCVQDTFERAWIKRDMYDETKSNYSTWLYTICRNICMSKIQQNQKSRIVDTDISDIFNSFNSKPLDAVYVDENYYTTEESSSEISVNNFDELEEKMYNTSIYEIEQMDSEFREIMYLKNLKGMKLKDIAVKLNMNESKVKNLYYKNKEELRHIMEHKYGDLCSTYQEAMYVKDANNIFDI